MYINKKPSFAKSSLIINFNFGIYDLFIVEHYIIDF
jgi:hypothetical protein